MKARTKIITAVFLILNAVALGWILFGALTCKQPDWTAIRIDDMKYTCEQSYKVIDGPLEQRCGAKMDALAAAGYEVLTKDGKFWVER